MNFNDKVAVVTGANRGLGKEIARGLLNAGMQVVITGRDLPELRRVAHELGGSVSVFRLDVANEESVKLFGNYMMENFQAVDVLVNNAGIMGHDSMATFNIAELERCMNTNFYGAVRVSGILMPLLTRSNDARIINISSIMGSKDYLLGGNGSYRISKWALNGFTVQLANELRNTRVKVFAVHPGWVQTDMGGPGAHHTVEQGADTPVWLATTDINELETGWFYSERRKISY